MNYIHSKRKHFIFHQPAIAKETEEIVFLKLRFFSFFAPRFNLKQLSKKFNLIYIHLAGHILTPFGFTWRFNPQHIGTINSLNLFIGVFIMI